ncbi:uncharacterized protein CBL_00819 [Carabus blaptoides fortunei]
MTETVVTVQEAPHNNAAKPTADNQTAGGSPAWLRINIDYWRTLPGMIKIAQVILGILCMGLASPAIVAGTHWFLFVVTSAFLGTLIWCIVYTFSIREILNLPINWILTELLNTSIVTVLYAIAFIVQLSVWSHLSSNWRASNIAAGSFGLFNFGAYAAGSYFFVVIPHGRVKILLSHLPLTNR